MLESYYFQFNKLFVIEILYKRHQFTHGEKDIIDTVA